MSLNNYLDPFYDEYPRIEGAFQAELDKSLGPRGPDMLFDMAAKLGLSAGASVLDLGCGEGRQAIKLAEDLGFAVRGVDPVARNIEVANEALAGAVKRAPELGKLVRFEVAGAEELPIPDRSFDLIWCKDVLIHIAALEQAFGECRRVLRAGGRLLIYHSVLFTERMEPREAEVFLSGVNNVRANTDPQHIEDAFTTAGFQIDERVVLGGEWGERDQEDRGEPGRRLIHASRMLRDPERYIAKFGQPAYDMMLGDCLWHVYRMIGKLSGRVYMLSARG